MTLFRQYFKAQFVPLLIWVIAAALISLLVAGSAPAMVNGGLNVTIQRMPEQLRGMLGDLSGLTAVDSFVAMENGKFNALLLVMYAVLLCLGVITREVDRRTVDFLLAQPVERRQVVLARFAVVALNTAVLAVAIWVALWGGLKSQGLQGSWGPYAVMLAGQWLMAMAVGALTLLLSVWIDDYGFAVKSCLGVIAGLYFLEYMLKGANLSRWARGFNPFSYVDAATVIRSGLPTADWVILLVVAVAAIALSIPAFERKQIAA